MHRTEGTYNLSNLFTNGPPGTRVEQNWLNAVQEEIAYIIEQAGISLLTADTETRQQLKQALDYFYTQLPAGTTMIFGQNLAPTGWTRKTDWANNAMLCFAATGNIASGGSANPQSGHTHTGPSHYHAGGTHTLTTDEIPSHRHSEEGHGLLVGSSYLASAIFTDAAASGTDYTGYTGGGSAHNHGNTSPAGTGATGAIAAPVYQEVIAATKD